MKIKDLQFPRYFLTSDIDLPLSEVTDILETDIEVISDGSPDTVTTKPGKITYTNPSSITKFLFNVLYNSLSPKLSSEIHKDKLGLALLQSCKNYVYADYDPVEFSGPPLLVSLDKIPVVRFALSEIIEPLAGVADKLPVFYSPCHFTDVCRIEDSRDKLAKQYRISPQAVGFSDFPIVLTNSFVYNEPARMSHLLIVILCNAYGEEKAHRILRTIMLDEEDLLSNLVTIIKTIMGKPHTIVEFLHYLGSHLLLDDEDTDKIYYAQENVIMADKFLAAHVKIADFGNPIGDQNSRVHRQWSQWSMLLGLIEKQLEPMRGSMWPATENLKPIEDQQQAMIAEREEKKGDHLNFEQLLEVSRDMYNHKAKPGVLVENLLKDNRVWKV